MGISLGCAFPIHTSHTRLTPNVPFLRSSSSSSPASRVHLRNDDTLRCKRTAAATEAPAPAAGAEEEGVEAVEAVPTTYSSVVLSQ